MLKYIYTLKFFKKVRKCEKIEVQIFYLINCTPLHTLPIKLEQLASYIKWDNFDFNTHVTDVNVKISFFFFFFFSLFPAFGFLFLFSLWFELTRTLLSFVSCRSFCFWFGLFPLLSQFIPFFQSVSGFCFCFCMPQKFLLSYRCIFVSTFERLLLQQATFKAFTYCSIT